MPAEVSPTSTAEGTSFTLKQACVLESLRQYKLVFTQIDELARRTGLNPRALKWVLYCLASKGKVEVRGDSTGVMGARYRAKPAVRTILTGKTELRQLQHDLPDANRNPLPFAGVGAGARLDHEGSKNNCNAALLESWLTDYCSSRKTATVPIREVQRKGPGVLRNRETLTRALDELVRLGRVTLVLVERTNAVRVSTELLADALT
jgi:hypothetical protein